jgi:hypothetical protein
MSTHRETLQVMPWLFFFRDMGKTLPLTTHMTHVCHEVTVLKQHGVAILLAQSNVSTARAASVADLAGDVRGLTQELNLGRRIALHLFPYISGSI